MPSAADRGNLFALADIKTIPEIWGGLRLGAGEQPMPTRLRTDTGKENDSVFGRGGRRVAMPLRWFGRARQSFLIFCYHGVSKGDEHLWDPRLYIKPDVFRKRLTALRHFGYQVLPLNEALHRLSENSLSGPTAVLTFDDGWHDFHDVAWPMLREFQFPATVYQTSYYSQYNRPVFDTMCRYLLWKGRGRLIRAENWAGTRRQLDLTTDGATEAAWQALFLDLRQKRLSAEQKDSLLERLAKAVEADYGAILASRTLHLMNVAQIREIAAAGVDVQLHTHRHRLPLDRQLFFQELEENRAWIEAATNIETRHFCYPNGAYRPEVVRWLREAGIRYATTCEPGAATRRSEPLLLPRFTDANSITQAKFESWLTGVGRIGPTFRRVLRSAAAVARIPLSISTPLMPADEPRAIRRWNA